MNSTLFPESDALPQVGANNSTVEGVPMSTKITISVLTGVAVFGFVIVLVIVVCHLIQLKKSKKIKKSGSPNSGPHSNQMAPPNSHFQSSTDIPSMGTYPSDGQFKEFDNWAYTPGSDQLDYPDVVSDLNRKNTLGSRDIQWTTISLQAHENYDYERYGRIPRAKLYVRKEDVTS